MKTTDLHIHSTYSDGTMSVEQLIKKAKETGLQNISITDHDTTEQIPDCIKLGKEYDLHVIPGVELSCSYTIRSLGKKQGIHLLGYGINPEDDTFQKVMAELRNKRLIRAKQISEKFIELGFKIDFENTLAKKKGSVERPEIARAVFYNPENKDMLKAEKIEDYPSFFNTYISDKGKAFVPREEKISFIDGIKLIHSAGGKAVWAHSYYNIREGKFNNPDLILDELLKDFIDAGLDGI